MLKSFEYDSAAPDVMKRSAPWTLYEMKNNAICDNSKQQQQRVCCNEQVSMSLVRVKSPERKREREREANYVKADE